MRSHIALSREQKIRDELLLQRRLSKSLRAASTLLPTVQRSGLRADIAVSPAGARGSVLSGRRAAQVRSAAKWGE